MRCFVEDDNTLKLRQEGIFLCLDGVRWSVLWERLYRFLFVQCNKRFNTSLKLGMLSWHQELETPPDAEFLAANSMPERGRFLTPLVEDVFPKLEEKAYNLFILSSTEIYDRDDWEDELGVFFNSVISLSPEELEQKPPAQLEEYCLHHLLGRQIEQVSISFQDSVCYDVPEQCTVSLENGLLRVSHTYNEPFVDIPLKTFGLHEYATLSIESSGFAGKCCLQNTRPEIAVFQDRLCDSEGKLFFSAIEGYARNDVQHFCPLCDKSHRFSSRAFLCSHQKSSASGVFAQTSLIFHEVEQKRRYDSRYVFFRPENNTLYWLICEQPVMCVGQNTFVVVTSDGVAWSVDISDSLKFDRFHQMHNGLFFHEKANLYVLALN